MNDKKCWVVCVLQNDAKVIMPPIWDLMDIKEIIVSTDDYSTGKSKIQKFKEEQNYVKD